MATLERENAAQSASASEGGYPLRPKTVSLGSSVAMVALGNLVVAATVLLVTRIYAHRYSQDEISAYLIFRLYGSLVVALGTLGMPIAVQRTVAFLGSTSQRAGRAALLGIGMGLTGLALFSGGLAFFSHPIANYLKHPAAADLWMAMLAYTFAQAPATLLSFVELARFHVAQSIAVLFVGFGLGPLLAVLLLPQHSLASVLCWGAVASVALTTPWWWRTVRWARQSGAGGANGEAGVLLRYGLPRVVATTADLMIDPALPWLAVQNGVGLAGAGYLAIGVSLLRPLSPVAGALNQVMVPSAAVLAAQRDLAAQSRQMQQITEWAIHVGLFCALQMAVWCDVVIRVWLGPQYLAATPVARVIALALAPWFVYLSSRGVVDGHSEKPVNAASLVTTLGVLLVGGFGMHWLGGGLRALAGTYLAARLVLAALTLGYGRRALHLSLGNLRIATSFLASAALALVGLELRHVLPAHYDFAILLLFGPLAALAYLGFMIANGAEWGTAVIGRLKLPAVLRPTKDGFSSRTRTAE